MAKAASSRPVVFIPHYHEAIRTFQPIIEALRAEGVASRLLLFPEDQASQGLCAHLGLPTHLIPPLGQRLRSQGITLSIWQAIRARRFAAQFCADVNPAMLVMTDDRRYVESFLIHQARPRRIPSLVMMWAATNTPEAMLAWRQKSAFNHSSSASHRVLRWLARWLAPQAAVVDEQGRTIFWQPPEVVLALRLFANYPEYPWVLGGGRADFIAVTGEHYRTMLAAHGVRPDKIHVTGHPRHDQLYRQGANWRGEGRTKMCREIGAPVDKKLVVLGTPPVAHILEGTRAGHVSPEQMSAYLRAVISDLLRLGDDHHLIVKVHPRDAQLSLPYLDGHARAFTVVRDYEIAKLIAGSVLLVCQGSTIVFDAHILGTPIVTFDFYQTPGYDMWQQAGGVLHVTEPTAFLPTVRQILEDGETRARLAVAREQFLRRYVKCDGQATNRIVRIIQASIQPRA